MTGIADAVAFYLSVKLKKSVVKKVRTGGFQRVPEIASTLTPENVVNNKTEDLEKIQYKPEGVFSAIQNNESRHFVEGLPRLRIYRISP